MSAIDIGIIGLGVMGQRMLARLAEHRRLRARIAWDPDPAARAETARRYPALAQARSAESLVATPGLRSLYIASPPSSHLVHCRRAIAAGLAIFCEKPLAVDGADARRMVAEIGAANHPAAVNFSLASSKGLGAVAAARTDGTIGRPERVEIWVRFATWPEGWQASAGRWLAERAEGGFTREVVTHWVFVLQRVLGPATVERSLVQYPADATGAELAIEARLTAGGLPVTISGRVGADETDSARLTLIGEAGAVDIHDWFGLRRRKGDGPWIPDGTPEANRHAGQEAQLDQLAALIDGHPHSLPSFAEALAVQETIESLLRR